MSRDRSYESSSGHSGTDAENSGHLSDHSLGYDEVGVSLIYNILIIVSTDREKHTSLSAELTQSQSECQYERRAGFAPFVDVSVPFVC